MKGGMAVPPFFVGMPVRYISHNVSGWTAAGLLRHLLASSLDTAVVRTRRDRLASHLRGRNWSFGLFAGLALLRPPDIGRRLLDAPFAKPPACLLANRDVII